MQECDIYAVRFLTLHKIAYKICLSNPALPSAFIIVLEDRFAERFAAHILRAELFRKTGINLCGIAGQLARLY